MDNLQGEKTLSSILNIKYIKYKPNNNINYAKPDETNLEQFINKRLINDLFENITLDNLDDKDLTELKEKKYNNADGEIEDVNNLEYDFINNILIKGQNITFNENFSESNTGKIIMYGYFRFLNINDYIEFELSEIFEKIKKNKWINVSDTLIVGLQDLSNQYDNIIYNRFMYYSSLIIYVKNNNKEVNIPIYIDKNGDYYIPTYRKIVNRYFTLFNISKKISFIEYNKKTNMFSLYFGERFNIMKYDIINNKIEYTQFPSYYNEDSIYELINSEKNIK